MRLARDFGEYQPGGKLHDENPQRGAQEFDSEPTDETFSLHDLCAANAMALALSSLRNGIECQGHISLWETGCTCGGATGWRKVTIKIDPQNSSDADADTVGADFTISAGLFSSLSRDLADLEQVKYGHNTRADLNTSHNEHGRVDLVFKPPEGSRCPVVVSLLLTGKQEEFNLPDLLDDSPGEWLQQTSHDSLAASIALGLKEFCKCYVLNLEDEDHIHEREMERNSHNVWMQMRVKAEDRQLAKLDKRISPNLAID